MRLGHRHRRQDPGVRRPPGPVNDLALTPDGARLVTAGDDRTLRVWDVQTGETLRVLRGHTSYVSRVRVALQGTRPIAVSSSKDTTVRVWDLDTFQCIHQLQDHLEWVSSLGVSRDGTRAISGSALKELFVWDLAEGRVLKPLVEAGTSKVIRLGRDGVYLRTGEAVGPGHDNNPKAMAFVGDDKLVSVEKEIPRGSMSARLRSAMTAIWWCSDCGGAASWSIGRGERRWLWPPSWSGSSPADPGRAG